MATTIQDERDVFTGHEHLNIEFTIHIDGDGPDFEWWIHSIDKVTLCDCNTGEPVRVLDVNEWNKEELIGYLLNNCEDGSVDREWVAEELANREEQARDDYWDARMEAQRMGEW